MHPDEAATTLSSASVLEGRYRILSKIGTGGMGYVYNAEAIHLGNCLVALKQTFYSDDELRKAFEKEAGLLATLRHPALPKVIDLFSEGHSQYLVMEYISGADLWNGREHKPQFSFEQNLDVAIQLFEVLEYLHQQQPSIIHRDIKPQNLKILDGRVILLDFGLAKDITTGTMVVGSSKYFSSLEQRLCLETDARSDLYSASATLYYLMTGIAPPDALEARHSAIRAGRKDPLVFASTINPEIPVAFAELINHSMRLEKNERPDSATKILSELMALMPRKRSSAYFLNKRKINFRDELLSQQEMKQEALVAQHPLAGALIRWTVLAVVCLIIGILIGYAIGSKSMRLNLQKTGGRDKQTQSF